MRLLVLAPHPDDDILGCTGLMLRTAQSGGGVRVVVITDGQLAAAPAVRERETQAALSYLGLPDAHFWRYPDGALPMGLDIRARYLQLVREFNPSHIALPSPTEAHPDHRRLTRGVLSAIMGQWAGVLMFYETTTPLAQCNHFEPVALSTKLDAMAMHASQLPSFNYLQWITGLCALRGASAGCDAAEGYLSYQWDGSPQNFFEHQPLVSVIVRADDHELLAHALRSIEEQEYDQLEVWVIWHGEAPPPSLAPGLMAHVLRGPGGRSANLNLGLAHASGEYLAFLDQDDVWQSHHVSTLITELQSDPLLDLAYGNYERVVCTRHGATVQVQGREQVNTEPYREGRLMLGNHIPLHTYVCRLRRARQIRFDEALAAYEDWDFLLRAELDGWQFRRVDATVAEYRLYPDPNQSSDINDLHHHKGYLAWTPVVCKKLFDQLTFKQFYVFQQFAESTRSQLADLQARHAALEQTSATQQTQLEELHRQQLEQHLWADQLVPATPGLAPWPRLLGLTMSHIGPLVTVLMPVCDPEPNFLTEAIHSVLQQSYPHWELCLADDASTSPTICRMLQHLAGSDTRIKLHTHTHRQGIVAATTSAYTHATGQWITFVDHDDRLHPDALLEAVKAIHQQPGLQALYTDSDTVDRNGQRINTFCKPAWSPETLLHLSYMNHLSLVRRDVFDAIGGLTPGLDGCQDWDMWLRLASLPNLNVGHIPQSLYDWRASETSTAYSLASKPYVLQAALTATQNHLQRLGATHIANHFPTEGGPGVRHTWAAPLQPLTAVVLTHSNPSDLQRLLASLQASTYPQLHIHLVANRVDPADAHTHRLLSEVASWPNARVVHDNRPFNWAALNNAAARQCTTPWVLFLNDDVEWAAPDTLQQLARYLTLGPAIGAVGMRLMYAPQDGGGIQHDGIVTTTNPRQAAHNIRNSEQCAGLRMPRNVSAVTGACMLTPMSVFNQCGGFDERFAISFNDVDYCLHVRRLGYRIVQASDVTGIHHESRTRGLPDSPDKLNEILAAGQRLVDRWGDLLTERHSLVYQRDYVASFIVQVPAAATASPTSAGLQTSA